MVGETIVIIIFMIPLYVFLIWTYNFPEDSLLFGRRWMYQEEPAFSSNVIRYTKFASISTMIGIPFFLISIFFQPYVFGLVLIVFVLVFIVGALLIFTADDRTH